MKPSLAAGVTIEKTYLVDAERTIGFMGDAARVYATPMMLRDIEMTCRELLLQHLEPGEDSVGTRVELDHLGPTLLGMTVTVRASVTEVKGRAVSLDVTVTDPVEKVGQCRHNRFVVDVKKTEERLKAKAAKAKG
jgi:fluoroacetyl-CoA thioesterase